MCDVLCAVQVYTTTDAESICEGLGALVMHSDAIG